MADLDQLLGPPSTPSAFGQAQGWEARVTRLTPRGPYVVVEGFARGLRWGPCLPVEIDVEVGERVLILMTNRGRPWIVARSNEGRARG